MSEEYFPLARRSASDLGEILARIDQRLRALGLSERRACIAAGLSPSQIRTMRRQHRLGTQHGASLRTINQLADALRSPPSWLITGAGPEETDRPQEALLGSRQPCLRLAGRLAAGSWIEAIADGAERPPARVPPDPRYPPGDQSAYLVQGSAINRLACDGDFLIVVDRLGAGLTVRSGDIAIVTRKKQELREITARRVRMNGPEIELHYDSTDPKFNEASLRLRADRMAEGDTEITIGGLAVAVYRPLT
jgi:SOS-response transcriptional repressor LexA